MKRLLKSTLFCWDFHTHVLARVHRELSPKDTMSIERQQHAMVKSGEIVLPGWYKMGNFDINFTHYVTRQRLLKAKCLRVFWARSHP